MATINQPINYLVVHCSASKPSMFVDAAVIDRWHRARGFLKIGYHYVILRDGSVQKGRQDTEIGAHVEGHNTGSLGICLVGGLNDKTDKPENNFTPEQFSALSKLINQLLTVHPKAIVQGHRDFPDVHKACPCFDVKPWWKTASQTKYEINMTTPVQRLGATIGSTFNVLIQTGFFKKGEVIALILDDGTDCPRFRNEATKTSGYAELSSLELIPSDPVAAAKKALEAAQETYNKLKAEAAAAIKVTPKDLVNFAILRFKQDNTLRLVIVRNDVVELLNKYGHTMTTDRITSPWLSDNYEKANLTAKDFFNV